MQGSKLLKIKRWIKQRSFLFFCILVVLDLIFYFRFLISAAIIKILFLIFSKKRVLIWSSKYLYPPERQLLSALTSFDDYVLDFSSSLQPVYSLLQSPNIFKGKKVLDGGSGLGQYSQLIAKAGAESVIGLEFQERKVRWAKDHWKDPNLTFQQGSLYDLPFESESFDFIFSHTVFEHLSSVDIALLEIHRVLCSSGQAIIVFQFIYHRTGHHLVPYISIPWTLTLFDEEILCEYFSEQLSKDQSRGRAGFFDAGVQIRRLGEGSEFSLNFMAPDKFEEIIATSGFRIFKRQASETLAQVFPKLERLPRVGRYFSGSVTYVLEKISH